MSDLNNEMSELKKRVMKLETQIAYLMRRQGIDYREPAGIGLSPDILLLLQQGKEKDAIRMFMQETGASLKDAKRVIDSNKKRK